MRYLWYLFWAFYVTSSALWSGPDDSNSEIIDVERLEGTRGTFRGFEWCKNGDEFYITSQRTRGDYRLASIPEIRTYFSKVSDDPEEDERRIRMQMEGLAYHENNPNTTPERFALITDGVDMVCRTLVATRMMERREETALLTLLPRAGNLRINHPNGTVIMENIRLAGDLIINAKRLCEKGYNYSHNFVTFPHEEVFGIGTRSGTGTGGHWLGIQEHRVARDEDFIPYGGHNLINSSQ